MRRWILLIGLAVVGSGQLLAQDGVSRDALLAPLPIRDQFLLSNGFFFFEPESAHVLEPDEWSVAVQSTDANTFAKSAWVSRSLVDQTGRAEASDVLTDSRYHFDDTLYLIDGQTHRVEFAVNRGFGHHLELGVSLPIIGIGGGWSDAMIEQAHYAMGIGNDVREALRPNRETVYLRSDSTEYFRARTTRMALGDIALRAKYELTPFEDKHMSVSISGALEFPTGNPTTLDGSGSLDAGVQVLVTRDFRFGRVHASMGLLRLGRNQPLGTHAQILVTDTVAVSRPLGARTAATMQLTVSESPFRNIGIAEFNRRVFQLSAGLQRRVGRSTYVYVALIENMFHFENSADAGVSWGISRRF
jgi:hypothetical protein